MKAVLPLEGSCKRLSCCSKHESREQKQIKDETVAYFVKCFIYYILNPITYQYVVVNLQILTSLSMDLPQIALISVTSFNKECYVFGSREHETIYFRFYNKSLDDKALNMRIPSSSKYFHYQVAFRLNSNQNCRGKKAFKLFRGI